MSTVRFIADLHFDHKNIVKYAKGARGHHDSVESHNEWLISQWNKVVKKQDLTWVLGDVSFSKKGLENMSRLNGVKHLIMGNHDIFPLSTYQKYFHKIHGFLKYKGILLSHAPVKESSLRGCVNIHGHTHSETIINDPYFCVSVEACRGMPISLNWIQEEIGSQIPKNPRSSGIPRPL